MKRYIGWVLSLLFFIGCQSVPENKTDRLNVAASISPLADFVHQIGGKHVDVFVIVPAGSNPHQFELTPQLVRKLTTSDLVVLNGVGLEFWDKAVHDLDSTKIVDTSSGIEIIDTVHHDHDHEHEQGGNPHIWLDPIRAIEQVESIRQALVRTDPEHANDYNQSCDLYVKKLHVLDDSLRREISTWRQHKFITFHPAWIYFANRYGLEQAAVIEPFHGVESGPQAVANIIKIVKQIDAGAIFTEAAFPDNLSNTIARECGIETIALDPLGGSAGIVSYIDLMKYNVSQMAKSMK